MAWKTKSLLIMAVGWCAQLVLLTSFRSYPPPNRPSEFRISFFQSFARRRPPPHFVEEVLEKDHVVLSIPHFGRIGRH
jgi:hypothetical protein